MQAALTTNLTDYGRPAGSDRTPEARAHRDGSPTGRGRVDASAPRGNDPQQRAAIIGQSEKD